jgi:hypothetical protein
MPIYLIICRVWDCVEMPLRVVGPFPSVLCNNSIEQRHDISRAPGRIEMYEDVARERAR